MKSTNEISRLVDDLAGLWTEPVLEIIKAVGAVRLSVEVELQTWRALRKVLRAELDWQRAFRLSTRVSFGNLMEQVLRKATMLVIRNLQPQLISSDLATRIRRMVADRQATPDERRLYAVIVREPALGAAFKPLSRTDLVPRLHGLTVGA
jgi:hypothetical protein